MDAVEIDAAVVGVAKSHFGLKTDSRLRTHVADGYGLKRGRNEV